jgi:hypothetical protein
MTPQPTLSGDKLPLRSGMLTSRELAQPLRGQQRDIPLNPTSRNTVTLLGGPINFRSAGVTRRDWHRIRLEDAKMKGVALAIILALGGLALTPRAHAVVCAAGVVRAGCVGPNGAAVVRRPAPVPRPAVVVGPGAVRCAAGVYRSGCVGPNGAVVRRRY